MTDTDPAYQSLTARLEDRGVDVAAVELALSAFEVETPSWGYGDSGTRFGVFPQPGRPRDVFEKIADAAEVHRLTGTAPAVALHFPWDAVDDLSELSQCLRSEGLRVGAINANLFQDPDYKLGSLTNPDPAVRAKAVEHLLECAQIGTELDATAQSLWLADGTNYAGQDDLRARRERLEDGLAQFYEALPDRQELLLEYKLFSVRIWSTSPLVIESASVRKKMTSGLSLIASRRANMWSVPPKRRYGLQLGLYPSLVRC